MKTTFLGEGLIAGDSETTGTGTCRFGQEVGEKKNAGGHDKIGHISGAPSTVTPLAGRMRLMQWEWLCSLFDEM